MGSRLYVRPRCSEKVLERSFVVLYPLLGSVFGEVVRIEGNEVRVDEKIICDSTCGSIGSSDICSELSNENFNHQEYRDILRQIRPSKLVVTVNYFHAA